MLNTKKPHKTIQPYKEKGIEDNMDKKHLSNV